jgi:signal transduction histidine kinase
MYKINNNHTEKSPFFIAFFLLFLLSGTVLIVELPLWWKFVIELLFLAALCFYHYKRYGNIDKSETQKAKDRVSTAVIGLLHSTNGISSLQTYNQLIRSNLDNRKKVEELLDQESVIIDEYADKVKAIVSDLSESFRTERERSDLKELIEHSVRFVRLKKIRDIKIPVELSLPESPVYAHIYPSLFKTAIENILENSYNILLEKEISKGSISLTVTRSDGRIHITVIDNGRGLGGEERSIPLKKIKPGRSGRRKGNGLGLYVALEAVKECGGTLSLYNHSSGLEVTMVFPEVQ